MKGLGDNIFQRPFVRAAAERGETYLMTPWPELYEDLPVKFLRQATPLRTQMKNVARQSGNRWAAPPGKGRTVVVSYGSRELETRSIIAAMESTLPLGETPFVMDLPDMGPCPVKADRPIALVRPVTLRSEWQNEARNPRPKYVAFIAEALKDRYHVVSVADLAQNAEWMLEPAPFAHERFHKGELSVRQLLSLVKHSAVVVGGVGWIVPAAIAAGVPAFIVLGGQGKHNAPEKITDPRMNLSRIGWAYPDNYCRCADMRHKLCDKTITGIMEKFESWRRGQNL